MATVTSFTAARMKEIEDSAVVGGSVVGNNLILERHEGTTFNAGNVRGPQGSAATMRGTSSTSTSISLGSKTFSISPSMAVPFPVTAIVRASSTLLGNYMVGQVTASSGSSVTINISEVGGSGTHASWVLTIGAFKGAIDDHQHDVSDITSGTLPVVRGGTGESTKKGVQQLVGLNESSIRTLGIGTELVVIGASTALPSTAWPTELASEWGLTPRYYSVGGHGYGSGPGSYSQQVLDAANDVAYSNDDVAMVIFVSAGNNVRGNDDVSTSSLTAFTTARSSFPNAKLVCLPILWPADPSSQDAGTGGFNPAWHTNLIRIAQELRISAMTAGVEYIEDSWTWLTGLSDLMEAGGGIHPNLDGYTRIKYWVNKYLRGESTRADAPWRRIDLAGDSSWESTPDQVQMRVRREGWTVYIDGRMISGPSAGSAGWVLANIPVGFRPTWPNNLVARWAGLSTAEGANANPNGSIQFWAAKRTNATVSVTGMYFMG